MRRPSIRSLSQILLFDSFAGVNRIHFGCERLDVHADEAQQKQMAQVSRDRQGEEVEE